jgi:hypothetical protein
MEDCNDECPYAFITYNSTLLLKNYISLPYSYLLSAMTWQCSAEMPSKMALHPDIQPEYSMNCMHEMIGIGEINHVNAKQGGISNDAGVRCHHENDL